MRRCDTSMSDNTYLGMAGQPLHPTESMLLLAASGAPGTEHEREHAGACLLCRVLIGRLQAEGRQADTGGDLTALTAASPVLPEGFLAALRGDGTADSSDALPGQVWRAADSASEGGVALLVWVRKVLGTTAAVLPVVPDTDMADEYSLLVDADATPLGMELAVLTGVDGEILLSNLVTPVGTLNIAADVAEVRRAADTGREPPSAVRTGLPVIREDDQRIEYRQIVSELLGSLGTADHPAAYDVLTASGDAWNPLALLDALGYLSYYEAGLRVAPAEPDQALYGEPGHSLHPVACVTHLSTCVLVVLITGPAPEAALRSPRIAGMCRTLQNTFLEADSVAVCAAASEWPALMLNPSDTGDALQVPSGRISGPRVDEEPLELVTALRKLFDGTRGPWHDAAPVQFEDRKTSLKNVKALSVQAASDAVAGIRREAARAVIPSKREGYGSVGDADVDAVGSLIEAVLAGADPDEAVQGLLEEAP